jgi:hypothetical protein
MNLSETTKNKISKPNFHTTLTVLHNLWSNGRLDLFQIDKILRKDYGFMVQHLELDFMHVESLDGLTTYSLGDWKKYKKQ